MIWDGSCGCLILCVNWLVLHHFQYFSSIFLERGISVLQYFYFVRQTLLLKYFLNLCRFIAVACVVQYRQNLLQDGLKDVDFSKIEIYLLVEHVQKIFILSCWKISSQLFNCIFLTIGEQIFKYFVIVDPDNLFMVPWNIKLASHYFPDPCFFQLIIKSQKVSHFPSIHLRYQPHHLDSIFNIVVNSWSYQHSCGCCNSTPGVVEDSLIVGVEEVDDCFVEDGCGLLMEVFLDFVGEDHDESVVFEVDGVCWVEVSFQQDLLEEEGCCFVVPFYLVFKAESDNLIDVGKLFDLGEGRLLLIDAGS